MTVLYDGSISGDGSATLGGSEMYYASARFTTVGPEVRHTDPGNLDHFLRGAWLSFGDSFDPDGLGTVDWWRAPWHLDFVENLYTPLPTFIHSSLPLAILTTRVRWHVSPGSVVYLHIYGP